MNKLKVCWMSAGVSNFMSGYLAGDVDEWIYIDISDQHPDSMRFIKDCEIAYCSLISSVRIFRYMWNGMFQGKSISDGTVQQGNKKLNEKRIHPTQKPVALYEWILSKYAKTGDIILDTHVGSASSLIACHNTGHKFVGFELDKYYYDLSKNRLDEEMAQMKLSDFI